MDENGAQQQARKIDTLLFALIRQLAVDDDAVAELPLAQLRVCGILHRGPLPMSALSRDLGVSLSAMTQIADRLEKASLVKRVAEGNDRRVRCLRLTPRGESIMQRREDFRTRRMAAALAKLPARKRKEALAALQALVDACLADKEQELSPPLTKAIV
jgi:DNA-binding MarR family transcriptional regulator